MAITKGRSTVSAHTGKIQLDSYGRRIVDSAYSRKLTYGSDGRYTSSASKHVNSGLTHGWLGPDKNNPTKLGNFDGGTLSDANPGVITRGAHLEERVFDNIDEFNRAANELTGEAVLVYNNFRIRTDVYGRIARISGPAQLSPHNRHTTDGVTTTTIGNGPDSLPGDVGFHLIGDQFGGPINTLNVVPGNGQNQNGLTNLNTGAYSVGFENPLRERIRNNGATEVTIFPQYNDNIRGAGNQPSRRPIGFIAMFDQDTTNVYSLPFANQAGGGYIQR